MAMDVVALRASKKYTDETVLGGGAVVGKNVNVSSITKIDGGNRVEFSYTLDDGTVKTSSMDVMDGKTPKKGVDYNDGENGIGISKIEKLGTEDLIDTYQITFSDGNTFEYTVRNGKDGENGKTPTKGVDYFDGENGRPGFSPTITENKDNTDKIYKLDIETADGIFTTPNLKGADGQGGSGEGGISYDDMKSYVDLRIGGAIEGSY